MKRGICLLGATGLTLVALGFVVSGAVSQESTKPAGASPKTVKVEKGPFKIEVELKGVLEADEMTPLALRPQIWSPMGSGGPLVVVKAIEHGTVVKPGDVLLELDTEKLDRAISDLEAESKLNELALRLAEKELPLLEQTTPLELAAAERAKKISDEDYERYKKTDRAFLLKAAEFSLRSSRQYFEYAQEEFKQLEKMYKADDLVEETEEIILKRQRNQLESAKFYLLMAEKEHKELLEIDMPRRDVRLEEDNKRATLSLEKAQTTLPLTLNQKKLALVKLRYDSEKSAERLKKLKADREIMTVKAPVEGVVYYGRCARGKWTSGSSLADRLVRGGQVQPDEIIMTIVSPKSLFVRAEVDEKELHHVKVGAEARVTLTARPGSKLKGKVESVSSVPLADGKFSARIALVGGEEASRVAGLAANVKLVPYLKKQALTLPTSAVHTDELDEDKHYVFVPEKGGSRRVDIKVGQKTDKTIEILNLLKAGDEVLAEKPDKEKK